jgi:hypothetical protein
MGTKIRLGDLLVRAGLITENDLRVVLAQQKQHGGRLGEHLVRVNLCTDEQIARALARQLGLAFNDMSVQPPQPVVSFIPEKVSSRLQVLATSYNNQTATLTVAMADPLDDDALAEVAKVAQRSIQPQVASALSIRRAIEHAYTGIEVRDEGTSEFRLVDIYGREKAVKVKDHHAQESEEDLPSLGTGELEPLDPEDVAEHQPVSAGSRPQPKPPAAGQSNDGEEALRMMWALTDLLIERGYFTRAELMKSLRSR